MNSVACLEQTGTVQEIDENFIKIRLYNTQVCSSCKTRILCVGYKENNFSTQMISSNEELKIGDKVKISINKTHVFQAILLLYLIPLFIILTGLIILSFFIHNELITVISIFLFIALYYLLLNQIDKKKFKKSISILIKKIE